MEKRRMDNLKLWKYAFKEDNTKFYFALKKKKFLSVSILSPPFLLAIFSRFAFFCPFFITKKIFILRFLRFFSTPTTIQTICTSFSLFFFATFFFWHDYFNQLTKALVCVCSHLILSVFYGGVTLSIDR